MEPDAPAEFAEAPAQTSGGIFCTRCGFANPPDRGACSMCLEYLLDESSGANCPSCGAVNPGHARFCRDCGALIDATAVGTPARAELVERVLEAVGDAGIGPDAGVGPEAFDEDEDAFVGPAIDEYAEEPDVFEEVGAAAAAEGSKPESLEVPEEAIPGPLMEPAEEIEPDEDFAPPPPPGVISEPEEDFAPPPPPGVIEAPEEDFAPPPPPGVIAEPEEDFAPPPPPGVIAEPEDEFAPPPPPPGVVAEASEEFAPPPPPPGVIAEPEEEFAPPPPPPGAEEKADELLPPIEPAEAPEAEGKGEESETDFGDWALDFEEAESSDEEEQ